MGTKNKALSLHKVAYFGSALETGAFVILLGGLLWLMGNLHGPGAPSSRGERLQETLAGVKMVVEQVHNRPPVFADSERTFWEAGDARMAIPPVSQQPFQATAWLSLSLVALALALVCGAGWVIRALHRTRRALLCRVEMRTEELASTSDTLHAEIEEHKIAASVAKAGESFLQQIIDAIPEELMVIDRDYRILCANRAYTSGAAVEAGTSRNLTCHQLSHHSRVPCDGREHPCPLAKVIATRDIARATHRHYDANGNERVIELIAAPVMNENGEITHIIETGRDVTERLQAERDLKEREERLHLLSSAVEQSHDGIALIDIGGRILFANGAFSSMHGFGADELVGVHFSVLHTRAQMPSVEAANRELLRTGSFKGELWHARRDGSIFPTLMNNALLHDERGALIGFIGATRDITDIKEAEEALRDRERHFRSLIENASDIITILDADGVILYESPSVERILGYAPEYLEGRRVVEFVHPEEQQAFKRSIEQTLGLCGIPNCIEFRFCCVDGSWRWLEAVGKVVVKEDGATSIVVNSRDVTDRKRAEQQTEMHQRQLLQASKMATLGTLVAGVAHEINNPNFLIMANTSVLRRAWRDVLDILDEYCEQAGDFMVAGAPYSTMRDEIVDLFAGTMEGAERIKRIVQELRDYARERPPDLSQSIDLNGVVKSATALLGNIIRKSTNRFSVQYREDLPTVSGDPQRLEQVVINLIQNACQALADADKGVSVRTYYAREPHAVVVEVADEGVGMSASELPRITDPFYTTRKDSGGTGLGLSISSSIIDAHGGMLEFESSPGQGTTARVVLPITAKRLD